MCVVVKQYILYRSSISVLAATCSCVSILITHYHHANISTVTLLYMFMRNKFRVSKKCLYYSHDIVTHNGYNQIFGFREYQLLMQYILVV